MPRANHSFYMFVICSVLLSSPVAASENGSVAAYNVKLAIPGPTPCSSSGATGNGTSDDTAAIQCALDTASSAGGGIVFLPQGTYRVSAPLSVKSSVTLQGAGAGSVIKPLNGATIYNGVVRLWNSPAVSSAIVRDLHIDGNGQNLTGLYAGISLVDGANHNTITNVIVEYARAEGIGLYATGSGVMNDYNIITHNTLHDNGWGMCGQVIVSSGRYNQISGNVMYVTSAARTATGWGVLLNSDSASNLTQHNLVRGNRMVNTGYGGVWARESGSCTGCTTQVAWNEISDNDVEDNNSYGIVLEAGAGHQTITGNTVTGNNFDGIKITTNGNTVANNVVTDNGVYLPNGYAGIQLNSGATDNVIVGNVSHNVTSSAQRFGIQEQSGGNYNLITGNNVRGNTQASGVSTVGANTIANNNVGQ